MGVKRRKRDGNEMGVVRKERDRNEDVHKEKKKRRE